MCRALGVTIAAAAVFVPSSAQSRPLLTLCLNAPATIVGTAGNDELTGTPADDVIDAGGGDDVVDGLGGNDLICGDSGNDTLSGGPGDDLVSGGDGNDRLSGGPGGDELGGLAGDDALTDEGNPEDFAVYFGAPAGVTVDLQKGIASGGDGNDTLSGIPGVLATDHDDTLIGDANQNFFSPLGGDDTVRGGGGLDIVFFTGVENPIFADLTEGGAVGQGADALIDINGLVGNVGNDRLVGNAGINFLAGAAGDDTIEGFGGNDLLDGDLPPDTACGHQGSGNDTVSGGPGDDVMAGFGGNDRLSGDAGLDAVSYYHACGVRVDLARRLATGEGTDRLARIEAVAGSPRADTLLGDGKPNLLLGADGADRLVGRGGDDYLESDRGGGSVIGGGGRDYCLGGSLLRSCDIKGTPRGKVVGSPKSAGTVEYGARPACLATTRTTGVAGRRRRHVTTAAPPVRVVPPVHRAPIVFTAARVAARFEAYADHRRLLPAAATGVVTWQGTLFRYDARRRQWRRVLSSPALSAVPDPGGTVAWRTKAGAVVRGLRASVPPGRYAWRGVTNFGQGTVGADWIEPHVGAAGKGGVFQQACTFS